MSASAIPKGRVASRRRGPFILVGAGGNGTASSPALRAVLDPVRASRVGRRRLRRAPDAPLVLALLRSAAARRFAQGHAH